MRTLLLALLFICALVLGAVLAHSTWLWLLPGLAGVFVLVLGAGLLRSGTRAGSTWALVGLLVCAGLLRGVSVSAGSSARQGERGVGSASQLRSFEVVGASQPGARCRVRLRAGPGAEQISLDAAEDACPLAHGERVAVLTRSLGPRWQAELLGREVYVLDGQPALWRRPRDPPPRPSLEHGRQVYWRAVARKRQRAWERTRGDEVGSFVVAVGLGLRNALAPQLRERLRAAGLGHLIAVSGLHVAVAALWMMAGVRALAACVQLSPRLVPLLAWVPLWAYVGLTGGAPSAIRAAAMLMMLELGVVVGRPVHGPTSLAIVAAGMLAWHPSWLFDPGFGLSLAAMGAIVTAPAGLGVMAISWRISWATAPLTLLYFDHAPMHALLVNALALPLFAWLMPLALLASVAPGSAGQGAMALAALFARPLLDLAALAARVPGVGAAGLAALAGLGLGLHRWARRARPRDALEDGGPGARAFLPPRLACAVTLALGLALACEPGWARPMQRTHFDWIAMGTPRSPGLLVRARGRAQLACLYAPSGGVGSWQALLERVGVTQLAVLDARLPAAASSAAASELPPHLRELARGLARAGIELQREPGGHECIAPAREQLRERMRACRYLQGGRGRVLVRGLGGRAQCRVDDRWLELGRQG